jgi:hypothetical protein
MQLSVTIETTNKGGILATLRDDAGRELVKAIAPNLLTWHNAGINLFNAAIKLNPSNLHFVVSSVGEFKASATKYFETHLNSLAVLTRAI